MPGADYAVVWVQEGAEDKGLLTLAPLVAGAIRHIEIVAFFPWTVKREYDANGNLEYVGYAKPGTAVGTAEWLIEKLTYDGDGNLTDEQWALTAGEPKFGKAWTGHDGWTYT